MQGNLKVIFVELFTLFIESFIYWIEEESVRYLPSDDVEHSEYFQMSNESAKKLKSRCLFTLMRARGCASVLMGPGGRISPLMGMVGVNQR